MAREYPTTLQDFARISGVGERKRADFGHVFTAEIAAHLEEQPPQIFARLSKGREERARPARSSLTGTVIETLEMFWKGMDVEQIATRRGFVRGTIFTHLAAAIEAGKEVDLRRILTAGEEVEIAEAVKQFGFGGTARAIEALGGRYEYGHFKIYRASIERAARGGTTTSNQ
jgi:ATP-dependent DNA helicase RecQ